MINNEPKQYTTSGKMLGLTISTTGYSNHVKDKIRKASYNFHQLRRFYSLPAEKKQQLYIAYVRSILTYPPIPLNALSLNAKRSLQRIQNKAVRHITSTSRNERIRSQVLHNQIQLDPINIYLKKQADNIWNNIRHQFPDTYANLRQRPRSDHQHYPSSILRHDIPEDPLYV